MDLKQLQYFIAVVDEGSISAAAKRLHMAQPPLSTQMKLLERELGVVLFERGARRILLTDAGRLLYGRAQSLLSMASAAKRELDNLHNGLRGILRLGLISSSGTEPVRRTVMEFHSLYPDVHFEILEGNTFELLESLKNKEIEIALIRSPYPPDAGLETCALCGEPMCAAGLEELFGAALNDERDGARKPDKKSDGRQKLPGKPLTAADLRGKPLILYRRWEKEILSVFQSVGVTPEVIMMSDDARTSLTWAQSGLGIALVPASFAQAAPLKIYPLAEERLYSRLTAVRQKEGGRSRIAEQFFRVFKNEASRETVS